MEAAAPNGAIGVPSYNFITITVDTEKIDSVDSTLVYEVGLLLLQNVSKCPFIPSQLRV